MASETPLIWRWYSPIAWLYIGILAGYDDAPENAFLISSIGLIALSWVVLVLSPYHHPSSPEPGFVGDVVLAYSSPLIWISIAGMFLTMHAISCVIKGMFNTLNQSKDT